MNNKHALLLCGMHRSGTSLISGYLSKCGLHLGSDQSAPVISINRGYGEDMRIVDFHNEILKKKHRMGYLFARSKTIKKFDEEDRVKASKINLEISSESPSDVYGWKDPRTSLFMDSWQSVLGKDSTYLILFRHPRLVVDSLIRRGLDKSVKKNKRVALYSWYMYNTMLLDFYKLNKDQCVLIETEDVVKNDRKFIDVLNSKANNKLTYTDIAEVFEKKEYKSSNAQLDKRSRWVIRFNYPLYLKSLKLYRELQSLKLQLTS